jgi:hypothetical protein
MSPCPQLCPTRVTTAATNAGTFIADLLVLVLGLTTANAYSTRAESAFDAFPVMPGVDHDHLLLQPVGFGTVESHASQPHGG